MATKKAARRNATTASRPTGKSASAVPQRVKIKKKVQHLNVLLLKAGFDTEGAALKNRSRATMRALDTSLVPKGLLFVEPAEPKAPKWVTFLTQAARESLESITSTVASAVLFIESAGRSFAFTFGYGRNMLKAESFERDFGLKVVLNRVNPENIRSLDVRNFEELTIHTRRQTSRGSTLETFGLNIRQDLLRSVTGIPKDGKLARRLSGSDVLAFAAAVDIQDLPKKCKELLVAYSDDKYKERFAFIDQLRAVRDLATVAQLDQVLVDSLSQRQLDRIHLAPPEPQDWETVEGFTYSTDGHDEAYPDLSIDDYLGCFPASTPISIDTLRDHRVGVRYRGSEHSVRKWTVYDTVVFETMRPGKMYVLTGGDWFEVAPDFATRVADKVAVLARNSVTLIDAVAGASESDYNKSLAQQPGFCLMDCKLNNSQATPVEVCDLFTQTRQFIHVKKKTRSATLSHLFAQGVVSAEAFISDESFRKEVIRILQGSPQFAALIPSGRPSAGDFEIVYAVIAKPDARWPRTLPFFSQLNLANASDRLATLGYKVSLAKIDEK